MRLLRIGPVGAERHMPELPEVETVARDLRALVVGATMLDFEGGGWFGGG